MAPARSSSSTATAAAGADEGPEQQSASGAPPAAQQQQHHPLAVAVVVAPAMGAIAKKVAPAATSPPGTTTSTTTIPASLATKAAATKTKPSSSTASAGVVQHEKSDNGVANSSDFSSSGADQQEEQQQQQEQEQEQQQNPVSDTFVRSLSGSKLSAEAPVFVPKGNVTPTGSGLAGFVIPGVVSGRSLPIPGVLPVQFVAGAEQPVVSSSSSSASSQLELSSASVAASSPPLVHVAGVSPPLASELEEGFPHEFSPPQTHASAPTHAPHPKPVVTEELKAKIVKQVEFYFSDQNLPTDNYLMKFVKKDPDGFVPIPVVASFKKIKNHAKNHGVVAAALRNSTFLVVSDDGKKVRRVHPLPDVDLEEVQSRTVVAENLPVDHSIESVEQLFSQVGNVKMVRVCQPEAANGANQTAAKFKSDMVVSNKLHALVEFETVEQAEKAVVALTDKGNWRSGLRVRLLLRRTFQGKHGFQQAPYQKGRKAGGEDSEDDETGAEGKSWEEAGHHHDRSEEAPGNDGTGPVFDRDGGKKGKGRGRGRGTAGRGKGQHGGPHPHHVGSNGSRSHQLGTSPQTSHILISSEVVGRPPPGPRMPDGTRGFTLGRGKVPILGSA